MAITPLIDFEIHWCSIKSVHPGPRGGKLSEQHRSVKSRGYEMRKRAEDVGRTRQRIVEAAVYLHGTTGPAATSIAAIAERAGVTRLTVYRHFPDEPALFAACSGHWLSQQTLPRPEEWAAVEDPDERLRIGLTDLYRFYRGGERMLTLGVRDQHAVPELIRQAWEETNRRYIEVLVGASVGEGDRMRRAAIGHAADFTTWHSLCREQGLEDSEAVKAMAALVKEVSAAN
ncbi:TetR/AcrR family transcriptional regulator [Streptomyces sp. S3(2020)]|uniref:TetR/AcrR family transcriptional regulator n=1 Tax=Streptomyces sp. S3(2020) TaxID=2732044 RepID=UPI001F10B6D7|nr:TetR/AcrR family transcriptional regulator [Streptomyces sp. S3(2020)]